ncbi:MAG: GDP-mannose 4,6-dehydratase [Candidatus Peribacteraceae bacterium]|nr:GDP-mannose 4,6-dehydratase [Candidatus Peribacteraceae bacterium]
MNILVTGGAGFIGRWVVKELLEKGETVAVLDDLSNGSADNLEEFKDSEGYKGLVEGSIVDNDLLLELFHKNNFELCIHCAAQINVQESLDNPEISYKVNMQGTYNILECARKFDTKLVLIGTCMVYDIADTLKPINENHPLLPASPYAGSKLAAENLAYSYYKGFDLPIVILRPFNTYGPFQKANMEGGVVAIFVQKMLNGDTLNIFGDGKQTRDLLYVEDCANFIVKAAYSKDAVGEVINAGTGNDISINALAKLVVKDDSRIKHIEHHHPQSEIQKLVCDSSKAKRILGWEPETSLEEGIKKLEIWQRGSSQWKN